MSDSSPDLIPVTRALLSVSDKTGIVELAQALNAKNIELLSTGGTAKLLREHNIPVIEVSDYTDFPEMMAGRVKTLNPKIFAGILGRRGEDDAVMQQHEIPPIDLIVVNLYPFSETIAKPNCALETAIENIDIGGPSMIRAAAKNHAHVSVLVEQSDYNDFIEEINEQDGAISAATRFKLAKAAFDHTARYDAAISNYLGSRNLNEECSHFPQQINISLTKKQELRYGENPHQKASFYQDTKHREASIATANQLQGKALSFNNINDADAALECVKSFDCPACVIVKHANPCGVALADSILAAYQRAFITDPTSSFGGIIAFNRELDAATAQCIIEQQFAEVIVAPSIDDDAQRVFATKKNLRVLASGYWDELTPEFDSKHVTGGLLVQNRDLGQIHSNELQVVSESKPNDRQMADLQFAWRVAKFVKSNAIVYAKDGATVGVGAGQMSRVVSAKIAAIKAQEANLDIKGAVLASDAFFPFRDGIDTAAQAGIQAIIQPGGSIRDDEVISAANEAKISMVFTGMRHFRH